MTDLLLTHGYFLEDDEKEREIMKPYPTLGLLYLSSYLRRQGFEVDLFDTTFARRADLLARLASEPGGVVGLYTNLMTRRPVLDLVAAAKAQGWTVVLGGPESANYPDEYLARGADVVVTGEGEETMAELLPALAERGPHRLQGVAGTVFRDDTGAVVHNPEREQIRERFRPDQVWYADDVFTISHRWLFDYGAELKRRGLRLPFETISRADRMMREEVLETLADLGCYRNRVRSEGGRPGIPDAHGAGLPGRPGAGGHKAAPRQRIQVGMFLMW